MALSRIEQKLMDGLAQHQAGQLDAAWSIYEAVLRLDPNHADALHLSGVIALTRGDAADAERRIARAVKSEPGRPSYHVNLGSALFELGRLGDAETSLRRAITLDAGMAAAYHSLGNVLVRQQRIDDAIGAYDRALVVDPDHLQALVNLADLMNRRGLYDPAATLLLRAVTLRPGDSTLQLQYAQAVYDCGRYDEVLQWLDGVLRAAPRYVPAMMLRGKAFVQRDRKTEAVAIFREIQLIDPAYFWAADELARVLCDLGRVDEAQTVLQEQVDRQGDSPLYSHYLTHLNYSATLSGADLLAAHRDWDRRFPIPSDVSVNAKTNPHPERKLRLGYVSGDFRAHSVAPFCEPLIAQHDRGRFEVYCYATMPGNDVVTARLKRAADHWSDLSTLSNDQRAQRIAQDKIDVLVDLAGHSYGGAPFVFALRPTPVQITYLGYPNTSGLSAMDWRITDARAEPPGEGETWNSERLLRLPDCFHCYRPQDRSAHQKSAPCLSQGHVTFGSFNGLAKISEATCRAWGRILQRVPNSRLFLKARGLSDPGAHEDMLKRLAAVGIAPDRVILSGPLPTIEAHLQRYHDVDIALDTFPYNGTATTCDALWMGVPVVALAGQRHAARVGVSLLTAVGHPEWIADDEDAYVERAVKLASDPQGLNRIHRNLREQMRASPLMDEPRFVRHLEDAYRQAWQDWCARQA